MAGKYPLLRAYSPLPGEITLAGEPRAGANDSDVDNFLESSGVNNWWEIKLEYVLPIGNAVTKSMATYSLQEGLLTDKKEIKDWNPLKTGTTVLVARQFNRYHDERGDLKGAVHAL